MNPTSPKMTTATFERVKASCHRWSDKALGVARAVLVDDLQPKDAAAKYQMSVAQARVTVSRFQAKAEKIRVADFMEREPPKLTAAAIEPFAQDIKTLRDKGYSMQQIANYLREHGIETSATTVRNFLEDDRA